MMPIMDGLEFRNRQLNDPELAGVPVVMMTADADPAARAKQMQINHFFGKTNLDIKKLIKTVESLAAQQA